MMEGQKQVFYAYISINIVDLRTKEEVKGAKTIN